jgi:hypothetical protein
MGRGLAALGVLAALVTTGATPPSPSAPALVQPEHQEIALLFVQTATEGTMEPIEGTPAFELSLSGVTPQVVWFSDRPARLSGHIPVPGFVDAWDGYGFDDDPPNAALSVLDAHHTADTVVVELEQPRYDPDVGTVRYRAQLLDEASGNLSHMAANIDPRIEPRFGHAALFIDDAGAPVIDGCVIQPWTWCYAANLSDADLNGADLNGADLTASDLSGAQLNRADLSDANLDGARLEGASLRHAVLERADLRGARLSEADFFCADLSEAMLRDANTYMTKFCWTTMPGGSYRTDGCIGPYPRNPCSTMD